ncbi:MAG: hypothetical protein JXQ23_08220 [Clostridia bacterium]|nr:hypothetical protein [Clostridia bacterium]
MHPFIEKCKKENKNVSIEYLKFIYEEGEKSDYQSNNGSIFLELAKLSLKEKNLQSSSFNSENYRKSIDFIYQKADCFDFILPGFILMMYLFQESDMISEEIKKETKDMILSRKYWIDEGGEENSPCYFTENHQILFHSNEYLAGQLYKDDIFINNKKSGLWHMQHAREFILRWLSWRYEFGFSEWLSNCYYHEDFVALVPLMYLAEDSDIRSKAEIVIKQMFLDMALHSYKGVMGSTHGRAYCQNICDVNDPTHVIRNLYLQSGFQSLRMSSAAVILSLFDYQQSDALINIANETSTVEIRQKMSLNPSEGAALGVDPRKFENLNLYWGMEAFNHRLVIDNTLKVKANDGYYLIEKAKALKENFDLCDSANHYIDDDIDYTSMPEANIYTYKTKDYMLSCAQDYKKGRFGFQQHIWQASLGEKAVVFTTHPGSNEYADRPSKWSGNRILPKAVAYENTLICIYNTDVNKVPTFTFHTHAYFPQVFMDESVETNGWFFGRKGDSYVAIRPFFGFVSWGAVDKEFYSYMGLTDKNMDIPSYEIIATGRSNIWITELGSSDEDGPFEKFITEISKSTFDGNIFDFSYNNRNKKISCGWNKSFIVNDNEISTRGYLRYDSKYCVMNGKDKKFEYEFKKQESK